MQLRDYRAQHRLSLEDVAEMIDAPNRGVVQKHEMGLHFPSHHYIAQYAAKTGGAVRYDDFALLHRAILRQMSVEDLAVEEAKLAELIHA